MTTNIWMKTQQQKVFEIELTATKGQGRRVWTSYGISNILYLFILSQEVCDL